MMVDASTLVGVTEVADRCRVTRAAVSNWHARHADFPAPVAALKVGPVWSWPDVRAWAMAHGKLSLAETLTPTERAALSWAV